MSDPTKPAPFPELRFDNANNSALSLRVLGEHARTGRVKVASQGIDTTGKLRLVIELPGSSSVRPSAYRR